MKIVVIGMNYSGDILSRIHPTITAANSLKQPGDKVSLWLINGDDAKKISSLENLQVDEIINIAIQGVKTYIPEVCLDILKDRYEETHPDIIIFDSGFAGRELAVRLGYRTGGTSLVDATVLARQGDGVTAVKPVYSSNIKAEFALNKLPYVVSIAKGAYVSKDVPMNNICMIENVKIEKEFDTPWIQSSKVLPDAGQDDLEKAQKIVVGGRGIGSYKNLQVIEELAGLLHGHAGATRPVVMSGWAGLNRLVGQSGSVVSPEICIVAAASGASPFTYGIINSQLVIAINSDKNAPIFNVSHVGVVGDYKEIISELIDIIKSDMDKA